MPVLFSKKLVYRYCAHLRVVAKPSATKANTRDVNWKKHIPDGSATQLMRTPVIRFY